MRNSNHFICKNCKEKVTYKAPGTKNRNHCPFCLHSVHVDRKVGDRRSACFGLMRPVGKIYKKDGEEVLVHQCDKCLEIRKNRIAGDDSFKLMEELPTLDYF